MQNTYKSKNYYTNIAYLMAFSFIMENGSKMIAVDGDEVVDLDVNKKDIYLAERRLRTFLKKIQPFKKEYNHPHVINKATAIVSDAKNIALRMSNASAEIIAINLLFTYFCDSRHIKMPSEFKYFATAENYYYILDKIESSKLMDAKDVFYVATAIVERNR